MEYERFVANMDKYLAEIEPKIKRMSKEARELQKEVKELSKPIKTGRITKSFIYQIAYKFSMYDDIFNLISELGEERDDRRNNSRKD